MDLSNYPKMALVEAGRRLGVSLGDYARASKADIIAKLVHLDAVALAAALEGGNVAAPVTAVTAQPMPVELIAGAAKVVPLHPVAAAPAARHFDISIVERKKASKVFGVSSLSDIEVDIWNDPDAPTPMPNYRWHSKRLRSVLTAIQRQRPIWLGGPAGTGKTEFVRQVCAALGRSFVRVQFDASLEAYHVIGGERVKAATTVWQDGLVLQGFRRPGAVILLDEVGFARAEYLSALHAALEPNAKITVPETGEVIVRAPGVTFVAADNSNGRGDPSGVYAGLKVLNEAFLNRFSRFVEFTYLPADEEAAIVADVAGVQLTLARLVVDFLQVVRAKADTGAIESPPSMREAFYLCEAIADGIAPRDAFTESVVNRAPVDCKEVLQQLWVAAVDADMVESAAKGNAVTLKPIPANK